MGIRDHPFLVYAFGADSADVVIPNPIVGDEDYLELGRLRGRCLAQHEGRYIQPLTFLHFRSSVFDKLAQRCQRSKHVCLAGCIRTVDHGASGFNSRPDSRRRRKSGAGGECQKETTGIERAKTQSPARARMLNGNNIGTRRR
jgi:hypothetical protein